MSIPLFIHLEGSRDNQNDQRIGAAYIWLDGDVLRVRQITLEEGDDNARVSDETRQQLRHLSNEAFNDALKIPLTRCRAAATSAPAPVAATTGGET